MSVETPSDETKIPSPSEPVLVGGQNCACFHVVSRDADGELEPECGCLSVGRHSEWRVVTDPRLLPLRLEPCSHCYGKRNGGDRTEYRTCGLCGEEIEDPLPDHLPECPER
ncbi:hypothetical protein JCM17823_14550 [Halorubrum gandharaense]